MAKIRFNSMAQDGHVGISISVRDVVGSAKPLFVQQEVARHVDIEATKKDPLA